MTDGVTKIVSRDQATTLRGTLKTAGKVVGFTSGVFDLLHAGHVEYLEEARRRCDFLIVGINSDASVRALKGDSRPLNSAPDRARVLAGLSSVDCVFVFEEHNNNENIKALKPDRYLKAGDYSKEKLSSAAIVESFGGTVEIVPFKEGLSTTGIIEKILADSITHALPDTKSETRPVAFLDRDGTIVEHVDYLHEVEKLKFIPGAIEAMKRLSDSGFRLVVITNQPGIGLGYFSKEEFFRVNRAFLRTLGKAGVSVSKVYFCPHSFSEKCTCRKPDTGLVARAEQEMSIDKSRSFFIGDMTSDIECGKRAGVKTALVQTGEGGRDQIYSAVPDITGKDLLAVSEQILAIK